MDDQNLKRFSQGFKRDTDKSFADKLREAWERMNQEKEQQAVPQQNQPRTSMNNPLPMQQDQVSPDQSLQPDNDDLRKRIFAQIALEKLKGQV